MWELYQCVNFLIRKVIYSGIHGRFVPFKRPGILIYAFSIGVTARKVLNFYLAYLTNNFKSQILLTAGACVCVVSSLFVHLVRFSQTANFTQM
jgi:hypothetical protein